MFTALLETARSCTSEAHFAETILAASKTAIFLKLED